MRSIAAPILLSFYGLSNGKKNLFFGKLAYSPVKDLAFKNYNRLKTFRTIVALYLTRPIKNADFTMAFDHGVVNGKTDDSGSFWCEVDMDERQTKLMSIRLADGAQDVLLTEELYPNKIHAIKSDTIVVSDLDDTLIHSFIGNKLKQVRTLLFTSVEKRRAVVTMANLIKRFSKAGAEPFYLSNSEQNLYPMLFRFLVLNEFPPGPMFLRQYVRLRYLVLQRLRRFKNTHKRTMLEKIIETFPDKKYILIGDNTQHDISIYLETASQHPKNIRHIFIREVTKDKNDEMLLQLAKRTLSHYNIGLYYASEFPEDLVIPV